ncbi:MAG: NAD-dependent epimerase/dehydratase family protein [Acidimicrobiaceae bacterium]|nr:NAD-dependent epimerase/dehydratase family protein [Acidimicrobiaceae bacterium]
MKVLVTGATGYLGSIVTRRLVSDGHDVRLLVRTPAKVDPLMGKLAVDASVLEVVEGDITDASSVTGAVRGCEAVVHCAAIVATDPAQAKAMDETNLAGTQNVLGAAVAAGCDPIMHISSAAALFPFQTDPVTADHPVMGNDEAYGRSKAACERYARSLQDSGKPVVTVYPSGIIGPDDWTESINLSSAIMWFEKGFPIAKGLSGNYVDVRDVAAVVSASLKPGQGPKRLLAFGTHVDAREHVAALTEATGAKIKTFPTPRWLMWTWGRLGDIARRFDKDIVMTSDGYDYLFNCKPGDDSATEASTGVTFRPVVETFRDMARWMYESGRLKGEKVGVLADD